MRHLTLVTMLAVLFIFVNPGVPGRICVASASTIGEQTAEPAEEPAEEEQDDTEKRKLVESKRERKMFRMKRWVNNLEGDKQRIYEKYGYPAGRYREEVMGVLVEKWVYPGQNNTFTFEGNKLIRRD